MAKWTFIFKAEREKYYLFAAEMKPMFEVNSRTFIDEMKVLQEFSENLPQILVRKLSNLTLATLPTKFLP